MNTELNERIPNNVNLSEDPKLLRALEKWLPNYRSWWREMGPEGFQETDVFLRTAISVDAKGWAHFDHVKMPDYRWGIFLTEPEADKKIGFGDFHGEPAWQEVPGEFRGMLRRIIVTQGDTEPASVEQQRLLGQTAPSLYDLRNLFQVNVEEGRHLWAMVYLLHRYFGRDGREEAEALLERRSGNPDKPRILGAFNEPIRDWLEFFMFTMFTDRDGKFQLFALAESGFDPLARTTRFMLTEEAHHMFVGETGVARIIDRTVHLMRENKSEDARQQGGIDLPTIQRYLNLWYSVSADLFGGEISSNAADYFASGLKGRYQEDRYTDHLGLEGSYPMAVVEEGRLAEQQVPLRNALNEVLRDAYIQDCQRGVDRWNRILRAAKIPFEFKLPDRKFHRQVGLFAGHHFTPEGELITPAAWQAGRDTWLPSAADLAFVQSLMHPVRERGQIANWIAPARGISGRPFDFDYVRMN